MTLALAPLAPSCSANGRLRRGGGPTNERRRDSIATRDAVALLPVRKICLRQCSVAADDYPVLCVTLLRRFREVERAGKDRLVIENHDLVVRNRWLRVYDYVNTGITEVCSAAVPLRDLTLVENDFDVDAAVLRALYGCCDWGTRERVRLNPQLRLRPVDCTHQEVLATRAVWDEAQLIRGTILEASWLGY